MKVCLLSLASLSCDEFSNVRNTKNLNSKGRAGNNGQVVRKQSELQVGPGWC